MAASRSQSHARRRVYLDYNATAPVPNEVMRAVVGCCVGGWANPESLHTEGRRAAEAVRRSRAATAALIGAQPEEVVFTSGGTEADNLALAIADGRGVVTTAVEHKAVLGPVEAIEHAGGPAHRAAVDRRGTLRFGDLLRAIGDQRPDVVSVMLGNNEVGNLYPVGLVAKEVRSRAPGTLIHTDAVNALGKVPVNVNDLGIDLMSISGHKIGALKGVGALYVRGGPEGDVGRRLHNTEAGTRLLGGPQEGGLRAGTQNVPGIVSFGAAARRAARLLTAGEPQRQERLRNILEREIMDRVHGAYVIGNPAPKARLPNTTAMAFVRLGSSVPLVEALDQMGIAASTGSACNCRSGARSHVLEAMNIPEEDGVVRFSLGPGSSMEDVQAAVGAVVRTLTRD